MSALSTSFFRKVHLFPSLLPDATHLNVVGGNPPTAVFSYQNLKPTGLLYRARFPQWMDPAAAGVNLLLSADGFSANPVDAQSAYALDPFVDAWREEAKLQATGHFGWSVQSVATSAGSAPTVDTWWANWAVEVMQPTLADRLAFPAQLPPLTPQEQALAEKVGLLGPNRRIGGLPRGLDWIIETEIKPNIIDAYPVAQQGNVSASSTLLVAQESVRGDQLLFIAALSVSPGSGSDGLTVTVGIDSDDSYWNAEAFGLGSGRPVRCLFPATQQAMIQVGATSAVSNVQASGVVWRVRATDTLRVRVGQITEGPVYDRVVGGVA